MIIEYFWSKKNVINLLERHIIFLIHFQILVEGNYLISKYTTVTMSVDSDNTRM